ncbi:MAG: hypothetical protein LBT53_05785 [Puniceicoccales bacterium]|jgi:hypothetical protein|nr:hypothetical protein [Puniceicoccales bacterium]
MSTYTQLHTQLPVAFLDSFSPWWDGLGAPGQVFTAIGAIAGVITLVLLLLTAFGLDHGDIAEAASVDVSVGDISDGSLFSTRSVTAFFLGFGGAGSVIYQSTQSILLSSIGGALAGAAFLWLIYVLAKKLMLLQSDGTVNYDDVVGGTGTVYITIPAKRGGGGQAQITFKHRNEVVDAIADADAPIPSGSLVRVKERISGSLFLVETV